MRAMFTAMVVVPVPPLGPKQTIRRRSMTCSPPAMGPGDASPVGAPLAPVRDRGDPVAGLREDGLDLVAGGALGAEEQDGARGQETSLSLAGARGRSAGLERESFSV